MSQFSDIFEAVKDNRPKAEKVNKQEKKTSKGKAKSVGTLPPMTAEKINQPPTNETKDLSPATNEKRTGKSSNPSYTQVLTYIKRDTHKEVKKVLFEESGRVDLSALVEELLAKWLQKRK
jgi:hypothetical protein